MRKNIMLAACIFTVMLHGMDNSQSFCKFRYEGSRIRLTKGSIYDVDGEVNVIVVGINEQKRLDRTGFYGNLVVGEVREVRWNDVCIMKRECESDSGEDRDNPCDIMKHRDHNFYEKKMKSCVIGVMEPRMHNPQYGKKRENYFYKPDSFYETLQGEKAIEWARRDLSLCYSNVLNCGYNKAFDKESIFSNFPKIRIAIPLLGTPTGVNFPKKDACDVAIESIIWFLKRTREQDFLSRILIHLFVKKRCEFEWCKAALSDACKDQVVYNFVENCFINTEK